MMEVKVVEKEKDVFGASVSDFDPWADGGAFVGNDGDAGFGDFGNFEVMEDENTNDDAFFNSADGLASPVSTKNRDTSDDDRKIRTPPRKTSSRRGNPSRSGSVKGKPEGEDKEEEKEGSSSARLPRGHMRRRNSSRLLMVDSDDKEKKDSGRSRSRSADKEILLSKGEGNGEDASDKEHSKSGHGSRREALRTQRNSFRVSKRTALEESPSSGSASRGKSPPKRGVTRRQSSSRRLVLQAETSGTTKLATQQSIRSLFQNGDLGDADASPTTPGADADGGGCIVSHSRIQKPARSRSGLGKSTTLCAQALKSPEGEPQRRVNRSTSMNRKLDGPPSDISRRPPPQRTRSAIVPRHGAVRRNLSTDNLTLKESPEEDEDPLSPIGRRRPPPKSKSIGGVSTRRHLHKQETEGSTGSSALTRPHRRLGSKDEELIA
jgi:hypothetical protein